MRVSLCICLAITLTLATTVPAQHTPARVAIYKGVGVWANEGERALPAVLEWLGATYRWVSARDINTGALNKSGKPAFDLLIVPGGWAGDYISRVGGWSGLPLAAPKICCIASRSRLYAKNNGFCTTCPSETVKHMVYEK